MASYRDPGATWPPPGGARRQGGVTSGTGKSIGSSIKRIIKNRCVFHLEVGSGKGKWVSHTSMATHEVGIVWPVSVCVGDDSGFEVCQRCLIDEHVRAVMRTTRRYEQAFAG